MLTAIKPGIYPAFKNILFPSDFSACSSLALPYARAIAARYGATVHLVHVVGPEAVVGPLGVYYPQVEDERAWAERAMNELVHSETLTGVSSTQTITRGAVWDVVSKVIAERSIDLIVVGTHGRRGLRHFVIGSVAEQIFRHAPCPVLTVGPEAHDGLAAGKLRTIVYATDFSPGSLGALPYAMSLARTNEAKVVLVHAVHPIVASNAEFIALDVDAMVEEAKQELEKLVAAHADVRCETVVKSWAPSDLILGLATETNADLIVMGAHRGSVSHIPWATAHMVVCRAKCPVLTVRS